MISTVLSKIGLPILIEFVAQALGRVDHPVAQNAKKALEEVEGALAGGFISAEQMAEANRHAEEIARINMQQYEASLSEINQSLRAEISSNDIYVRRMRPTFGYLMAATWAAQMFGIAYVVVFKTETAAFVMQGMAALSTIWAVGLSVLGIYVYKRSEDKKIFSATILKTPKPKEKTEIPRAEKVKTEEINLNS
ncbi:MAG: 3TM-type holin [Pseudomonadota bacterium]